MAFQIYEYLLNINGYVVKCSSQRTSEKLLLKHRKAARMIGDQKRKLVELAADYKNACVIERELRDNCHKRDLKITELKIEIDGHKMNLDLKQRTIDHQLKVMAEKDGEIKALKWMIENKFK